MTNYEESKVKHRKCTKQQCTVDRLRPKDGGDTKRLRQERSI